MSVRSSAARSPHQKSVWRVRKGREGMEERREEKQKREEKKERKGEESKRKRCMYYGFKTPLVTVKKL